MEDVEAKILEFAGKMTDAEAAKKAGVSSGRIWQIRRKHGIPRFNGGKLEKPAAADKPKRAKKASTAIEKAAPAEAPGVRVRIGVDISIEEGRAILGRLTKEQIEVALSSVLAGVLRGA